MYKVANFEMPDSFKEKFSGVHSGKFWNGWATPYFTKETIIKILALVNDSEYFFSDSCDCVIYSGEDGIYEHDRLTFNGEKYYQIGDGWVWEIAD